MSESSQDDVELVVRVVAAAGCLFFIVLAVKMGSESLHARSTGELMSNWKNGKKAYQDGFKATGIFVMFAAVWCYCAIKPKRVVEVWKRDKK